jgi:hypothetical protein
LLVNSEVSAGREVFAEKKEFTMMADDAKLAVCELCQIPLLHHAQNSALEAVFV